MRFVIVDGLPYLLHNGKTYAVRRDEKGFTVGAEVKLASVPAVTLSDLSVRAKYPNGFDSIGANVRTAAVEQEEDPPKKQAEKARKTTTTKRGTRKTVNAK